MIRFLFRKTALCTALCGLVFPIAAAAAQVTPLSEPADPQPAANLIDTSPAAEQFPLHGRLSTDTSRPSWRFTGLASESTWLKYGLRPPAFAVPGNRPSDPAAFPVLKTRPVSRRNIVTQPRGRTATPKPTDGPAKSAAPASKGTVSAPTPVQSAATPKPATAELYSGPAEPVAPPSPALSGVMPQTVARGTMPQEVPAPAPNLTVPVQNN